MKLLMISGDRSLAAGKTGAFSETLAELHKHFDRIDILCPRVNVSQQVHVIHDNVYVHSSTTSLFLQPLFIWKKGKELFQAHHHTVMTVHEYPPFYNGIGARLLKRSIGIPATLEIHHIVGWPQASSLNEWIGRMLSRFFLASHTKHFEAVRVVNATVKSKLVEWGVQSEKISVIPSVYLDHALIDTSKNQEKKFDLCFAARLTDNKGLLPVLKALACMPENTLLVIGDGPVRKSAESLAVSLGIRDRVTFTGWLEAAVDVANAIASSRLFIMNSKSEGNPRVAIEAMALGVPVLATKVGIMPDVIQDGINGLFTDGTAADIALKADVLLRSEQECLAMGVQAMTIRDRFERVQSIAQYARFLQELA